MSLRRLESASFAGEGVVAVDEDVYVFGCVFFECVSSGPRMVVVVAVVVVVVGANVKFSNILLGVCEVRDDRRVGERGPLWGREIIKNRCQRRKCN